jgi:multimeric flavodoxin WrbA
MTKVLAVNGSPNRDRGTTGLLLTALVRGVERAGASVEVVVPSDMRIEPCECGELRCWERSPGECCMSDDMDEVMPILRDSEVLVLATPMYVPLPGRMQDFINRMTPLLEPVLETRQGRTRARYREGVRIRQVVLLATGGWWERQNLDTLEHIVRELAEVASAGFAGAILRPHAHVMFSEGRPTPDGQAVLEDIERAGYELISTGKMDESLLAKISRPLVGREELLRRLSL